jgi:hypothetical protein
MGTIATDNSLLARRRALSVQTYAKLAGVLILLSFVGGGFGEAYVPSKLIIATDAAGTEKNLMVSDVMFRLGFAGYLVEACCDVTLALIFYVLLRPVHRYVSLSRRIPGSDRYCHLCGCRAVLFCADAPPPPAVVT